MTNHTKEQEVLEDVCIKPVGWCRKNDLLTHQALCTLYSFKLQDENGCAPVPMYTADQVAAIREKDAKLIAMLVGALKPFAEYERVRAVMRGVPDSGVLWGVHSSAGESGKEGGE